MAGTEETKSEDVEMADAAPKAAAEAPKKKPAGKAPRFEVKKWNAVVSILTLYSLIPQLFWDSIVAVIVFITWLRFLWVTTFWDAYKACISSNDE